MPHVSIHGHHRATVAPSFQISTWFLSSLNNATHMPRQWTPVFEAHDIQFFHFHLLITVNFQPSPHPVHVLSTLPPVLQNFLNLQNFLCDIIPSIVYFIPSFLHHLIIFSLGLLNRLLDQAQHASNQLYHFVSSIYINLVTQVKKVEVILATFLSFINSPYQINDQHHSFYLQSIWVYINIKCTTYKSI